MAGSFKPFESQWNKGSDRIDFSEFYYVGKTSVLDWRALKGLWVELENETVGKDFPDYDLKIIEKDASGNEKITLLTDGYKTNNSVVKVKVETFKFVPKINVYYEQTGAHDNNSELIEINLKSGDNYLGFLIEAELLSGELASLGWTWTDFKYVNIKLDKEDTPTEASISVTNTLDEDVRVYIRDKEYIHEYTMSALKPGGTFKPDCEPGTYIITVEITNRVAWVREITLSAGQNYVYNFEASDDCTAGKVTVFNNTPDSGKLSYFYYDGSVLMQHRVTMAANEKKDIYLNFSIATDYYLSWYPYKTDWFTLDFRGYTWTVTGTGSVNSGNL